MKLFTRVAFAQSGAGCGTYPTINESGLAAAAASVTSPTEMLPGCGI